MSSTLPRPRAPRTVRVTLAGHGDDLIKLSVFLEAVTKGHDPADALHQLRLAAIVITEMHNPPGRGTEHIAMTVELRDAA